VPYSAVLRPLTLLAVLRKARGIKSICPEDAKRLIILTYENKKLQIDARGRPLAKAAFWLLNCIWTYERERFWPKQLATIGLSFCLESRSHDQMV
jgi:hypothetical protein